MTILVVSVVLIALIFGAKSEAKDVLGHIGCFMWVDIRNIFDDRSYLPEQNSVIK